MDQNDVIQLLHKGKWNDFTNFLEKNLDTVMGGRARELNCACTSVAVKEEALVQAIRAQQVQMPGEWDPRPGTGSPQVLHLRPGIDARTSEQQHLLRKSCGDSPEVPSIEKLPG